MHRSHRYPFDDVATYKLQRRILDAGLYFAGYDANKAPAHNTAWIFRASLPTVLGASRQ
jgi:hypothetical protein